MQLLFFYKRLSHFVSVYPELRKMSWEGNYSSIPCREGRKGCTVEDGQDEALIKWVCQTKSGANTWHWIFPSSMHDFIGQVRFISSSLSCNSPNSKVALLMPQFDLLGRIKLSMFNIKHRDPVQRVVYLSKICRSRNASTATSLTLI